MKKVIVILGLLLTALGCMVRETRHTLYLHPDGVLVWSVVEQQVRSDEKDPAERQAEETEYLLAAKLDLHPVAVAFRSLGSYKLTTTLVRDELPFHVVTEGRFASVATLAREILYRSGVPGDAYVITVGNQSTLVVKIWPDQADESAVDEDDPMLALLECWDEYRIVLTEGTFIEAEGFEIGEDGAMAWVAEPDEEAPEGEPLVLSLTWIVN